MTKKLIVVLLVTTICSNLVGCSTLSEFEGTYKYTSTSYIEVSGINQESGGAINGVCKVSNVYGINTRYDGQNMTFKADNSNNVKIIAPDNPNLYWTGSISETDTTKTITFKDRDYVKN